MTNNFDILFFELKGYSDLSFCGIKNRGHFSCGYVIIQSSYSLNINEILMRCSPNAFYPQKDPLNL